MSGSGWRDGRLPDWRSLLWLCRPVDCSQPFVPGGIPPVCQLPEVYCYDVRPARSPPLLQLSLLALGAGEPVHAGMSNSRDLAGLHRVPNLRGSASERARPVSDNARREGVGADQSKEEAASQGLRASDGSATTVRVCWPNFVRYEGGKNAVRALVWKLGTCRPEFTGTLQV